MKTVWGLGIVFVCCLVMATSAKGAESWGPLFGPKQYVRTADQPNSYHDSFLALPGTGKLFLTNGHADGTSRVSAASIWINGKPIVRPEHLSQQVFEFEIPVDLSATNEVFVSLASQEAFSPLRSNTYEVPDCQGIHDS